MASLIGKPVKRVEDKRFITGKGRYTDDIVLPGMVYAYIIRSPYAHARINSIDTSAATAMDGVVAVFTGKDITGITGVPTGWQVNFKNGDTMKEPPHPLIVADKVRHMGDNVAVVIATSKELARDAADMVEVDYEELDAVADAVKAVAAGAPLVHDDVPNNIAFDFELGDKAKTDEMMAKADHITTLEFTNQRIIPNAIEPRCAIGDYNSATDRYTLYTTSQNPHLTRLLMCAF
ncbi:MAG: xanthine dehydrogenase family protein molybdopterin-binding subunit, partial [Bacteroidetes bacterium]|nr:xanthine dehydrogenase family protein molybdopterin-binding subunit [Bacteroidota bacterium]